MFRVLMTRGKFNSACASVSNLMLKLQSRFTRNFTLIAVLAAGCYPCRPLCGAAGRWDAGAVAQAHSDVNRKCPSRDGLGAALGNASDLMGQSRYQDAVALLQPLAGMDCDARASLLLAAAFEGQGDQLKATGVLQQAHSVWPSDSSIAASLAREYLNAGQTEKAVAALNHFHATPATRPQEMKMAVVVYLTADKLTSALTVAQVAYKAYPSLDTLLLLANVLQLEGRYPDVNRILGTKRAAYSDSPKFLITLAESEFDASIYGPAREDIERAISLDGSAFQAHYILGNILVRLGESDRAVAEYNESIRLNPHEPRTYYQLALVLREKMDIAGEESVLEQALAADDRYAPAHCELGRILLDQNRLEEAVNHLNMAVQYNPRSEEAYFLLVRAYRKLGERDKAEAMVKRLVAVRKENRPNAMNKLVNDAASRLATNR